MAYTSKDPVFSNVAGYIAEAQKMALQSTGLSTSAEAVATIALAIAVEAHRETLTNAANAVTRNQRPPEPS
jgi:hypothetical protein